MSNVKELKCCFNIFLFWFIWYGKYWYWRVIIFLVIKIFSVIMVFFYEIFIDMFIYIYISIEIYKFKIKYDNLLLCMWLKYLCFWICWIVDILNIIMSDYIDSCVIINFKMLEI